MQTQELKQYIYEQDKVEDILESIGCHGVSRGQKGYRCGLPQHSNKSTVSVENSEYLKVRVFHPDKGDMKGDIITLVMELKGVNFPKANKYIHDLLGLTYSYKATEKTEVKKTPLDIFKKAKARRKHKVDVSQIQLHDFAQDFEYRKGLHIDWLREGILPFTAEKFALGYDDRSRRILIPHRLYCATDDKFVGLIGRTTIENHELFDIPKYFPLIPYPKGINLYGLNENYEDIIKEDCIRIGEAEKYVLKNHSRSIRNCVALMGHYMSEEQRKIIIGLGVSEVVIDLDKGLDEHYIHSIAEMFYGVRKVSIVVDKYDRLKDKENSSDVHLKLNNWLFKHRVTYDYNMHVQYLEEKEKRNGSKKNAV
jgi:hypothetical protein